MTNTSNPRADAYLLELGTLKLERALNPNFDDTRYGEELNDKLTTLWYSLTEEDRDYLKEVLDRNP